MQISTLTPWRRRRPVALSGAERLFPLFPDLDGFFEGLAPRRGGGPSLDVTETEDAVVVTAELPGVAPEDVELQLVQDGLLLKGEKRAESVEENDTRHVVERSYGSFQRFIGLPAEIAGDGVDAGFKDGVLTVRLPKAEPSNGPRKIEIRSEG